MEQTLEDFFFFFIFVPILRVEREHLDKRRESHRLQRETTLRLESPKELGFTAEVLGVESNLQCCAGPQLHTPVRSESDRGRRHDPTEPIGQRQKSIVPELIVFVRLPSPTEPIAHEEGALDPALLSVHDWFCRRWRT